MSLSERNIKKERMSTGNADSNIVRTRGRKPDKKFNIKEVNELEDDSCVKKTSDQGHVFHEHRKSMRTRQNICSDEASLHSDTQSNVENVKSSVKLKKAGCSKVVDTEVCSGYKSRRKLKTSSFVTKTKHKKKSFCFTEGRNHVRSDTTCVQTQCGPHKSDGLSPCSSKRKRKTDMKLDIRSSTNRSARIDHLPRQKVDNFLHLPVEIICYIFHLLTLREILCLEHLSKKMQEAVLHYLKNIKSIDFNEHIKCRKLFECNLPTLSDFMFSSLIMKLPKLQNIYNFHPRNIKTFLDMDVSFLTVSGVCRALRQCKTLEGIEISNLDLLQELAMSTDHLSNKVKVIGKFQNMDFLIPYRWPNLALEDKKNLKISHLHLTDCSMHNLPQMDSHLEHLYLRNVSFVDDHPFQDFSAFKLKSFVMSQCEGPRLAMKYLPLISALADAYRLKRVELQDIPYLGGIIKNICATNWREGSFRRLESIVLGNCSNLQNADIGYLVISAACRIETLKLQPSLSKDAIFHALVAADVTINPGFQELCLGWQDHSTKSGLEGVSDSSSSQCCLTDSGMRIVGQCFPSIKKLDVRNSPYFKDPIDWLTPGQQYWKYLEELCICNCQCLHAEWFADFLTLLPNLKFLTLQKVFKEPPFGCSRVGLTAGTGIGAVTTMENNDIDDNIHIVEVENEANENGAVNHMIENVANRNGAENHVIENVANQNGAENHVIENVANQNGAMNHVIDPVANQNGALNPESNTTQQASERLHYSRYNLRHSPRQSSTLQHAGVSTRSNSTAHAGVNDKPRCRKRHHEPDTHCDRDQASDSDTTIPHSHSSVDKSDNAHCSSKRLAVSTRGKALVTKNGIVRKTKSSIKKRTLKRKCNKSTMINQSKNMETEKRVCTCKKPTQDIGCQVSTRDIKKSFKQSCSVKRTTRRSSSLSEKVIEAGIYRPASMNVYGDSEGRCMIHKPCVRDQSDGTSDPVSGENYKKKLRITHSRLEYIKLDDVGMSELSIDCPLLNTLSVSRCTMWKTIQFDDAPLLENVHISQCRVLWEPQIMHQIYRLPNNCSKFVSLRPLHKLDESLFINLMHNWDHLNNQFGSLMMFDHSEKPSETNYNKLRMKSWINMLERMTAASREQYGFPDYLEMEEPKCHVNIMTGHSANGSKWSLLTDNPWIELLNQCPNIDDKYLTNPDWSKEGVYCMEAKGHYSFWDAYADIQYAIPSVRSREIGLYSCNVLTYINLCDMSGTPTLDGLNVL